MYADDICHLAPSALCLQTFLDMCYSFVSISYLISENQSDDKGIAKTNAHSLHTVY